MTGISYVLYDRMKGKYLARNPYKTVDHVRDARRWGLLYWAKEAGSLLNVPRNVPRGCSPSKHYQDLPQVVVHMIDESGSILMEYECPPTYIHL